ncbi:MAG: hypothetical protein M3443_19415 [Actinomycetota bacterium]|nr:hypothetical protein [Actinomycetota bacterium]
MDGKSWRWFTVRLFGLPPDSVLALSLRPDPESDDDTDSIDDALGLARDDE